MRKLIGALLAASSLISTRVSYPCSRALSGTPMHLRPAAIGRRGGTAGSRISSLKPQRSQISSPHLARLIEPVPAPFTSIILLPPVVVPSPTRLVRPSNVCNRNLPRLPIVRAQIAHLLIGRGIWSCAWSVRSIRRSEPGRGQRGSVIDPYRTPTDRSPSAFIANASGNQNVVPPHLCAQSAGGSPIRFQREASQRAEQHNAITSPRVLHGNVAVKSILQYFCGSRSHASPQSSPPEYQYSSRVYPVGA